MRIAIMAAVAGLMSGGTAQAAAAQPCDRQCLLTIAKTYVSALVSHTPSQAPLARDMVLVENLKRIEPGTGLWKSATGGLTAYELVVPDVTAQQVGLIGVMQEGDKPIMVAIRLKLIDRRIVEAEHIVVHDINPRVLPNLRKPRPGFAFQIPAPYRDARDRLLKIGADYYDALDENNGNLAAFADDCERYENGMQTANAPYREDYTGVPMGLLSTYSCAAQLDTQVMSYIDTIDNRRIWIADEETGLVFGLSHFRHSMKTGEIKVYGVPGMESRSLKFGAFDLPAAHIYKIYNGKIHEIEAVGYMTEYMSPTGW